MQVWGLKYSPSIIVFTSHSSSPCNPPWLIANHSTRFITHTSTPLERMPSILWLGLLNQFPSFPYPGFYIEMTVFLYNIRFTFWCQNSLALFIIWFKGSTSLILAVGKQYEHSDKIKILTSYIFSGNLSIPITYICYINMKSVLIHIPPQFVLDLSVYLHLCKQILQIPWMHLSPSIKRVVQVSCLWGPAFISSHVSYIF